MRYTSPCIMCHPYCKCANKNIFILQKSFWRVKLQEHYDETTLTHNTQLERIIHNHLIKFWVKKEVQRIRHNLIKWTQINFKSIKATNQNPQWRTTQFLWQPNQVLIPNKLFAHANHVEVGGSTTDNFAHQKQHIEFGATLFDFEAYNCWMFLAKFFLLKKAYLNWEH